MLEDIQYLLYELTDVEDLKKTVVKQLEQGKDPQVIIDVLNQTLIEIGEKYENGDIFLSELMWVGYLASEITEVLKPYLGKAEVETHGKVVIGTVKGDIHDIGKNIVIMLLQSAGFQVVDLGVGVPSEKFVEAIRHEKPDVLGMSALLTSTMTEMKVVLDALRKNKLRDGLKVIIGGRPITEEFAREIGADGYAKDAVKAVSVIKVMMEPEANM